MFDIVVFAGTTEGCEICSFLAKNKVSVLTLVKIQATIIFL